MNPAKLNNIFIVSFFALVLSSCATMTFLDNAAHGIFQRQDVNMTEKHYAVADFLVPQMDTFVSKYHLIKAQPLKDTQAPEMSAVIAKAIPEKIGIRFAQLGYRVDLTDVLTSEDTSYHKPAERKGENPAFLLTGNYTRKSSDLAVSAQIVRTSDGRVVAVFDYQLPMSREIGEMSQPEAKIFRIVP